MRNVLVTGGSKGIGLACVMKFLNTTNYRITVLARTVGDLPTSERIKFIPIDLIKDDELSLILSKLKDEFDIIINNSGGPTSKLALSVSSIEFKNSLTQHLIASHLVVKRFAPQMINKNYGRIINIISVTANNPLPNMIVSNTVRGAMINWSKTLSKELGKEGITVNNVLPGYTETQRLNEVIHSSSELNKIKVTDVKQKLLSQIPSGRFGQPSELADLVYFLSKDESSYINGQSIAADGGWTPCI